MRFLHPRLSDDSMRLFRLLRNFAREGRVETLLEIAEDGIIDDRERPIYNSIMDELREIVAASLSLSLTGAGQEKTPHRLPALSRWPPASGKNCP